MPAQKIAHALVLILLIEMMAGVGLSVSIREVARCSGTSPCRAGRLRELRSGSRDRHSALVSVRGQADGCRGISLAAVCPGAPFAPLTALAKGNVHVSVGLMVLLAASSAVLAPVLLSLLLPAVARGADLKIDTMTMVNTLLIAQLAPLGIGLLFAKAAISTLAELRAKGLLGICLLIILCLAAGSWWQAHRYP